MDSVGLMIYQTDGLLYFCRYDPLFSVFKNTTLISSIYNMADDNESGYDFKLVKESEINLECPICLMLVRQAMELPCSHLLCRVCTDKLRKFS